jgi:hypothetical protein
MSYLDFDIGGDGQWRHFKKTEKFRVPREQGWLRDWA